MPAATPSRARCTSFQSLRANAVDDLEKLVANAVAEDEKRGSSILDAMTEVSTENVADRPWSAVFNPLAQDPVFRRDFWARKPFKLSTKMPFAVNCFTFKDLEKYAHMYPSHWAGTGTLVASGGWMMASIRRDASGDNSGISYVELCKSLKTGTVALNSAGFYIPPLAVICNALLQALQLPVWLNVYITESFREQSAPAHTDKQDVIAVQVQGSKRWRIWSPPPPQDKITADPFTRGKGQDTMSDEELGEPLLDIVMEPGETLYIPAAYPHKTDTATGVSLSEESVHLTLGIDTHVWDLNYACMRTSALERAGQSTLIEGTYDKHKLGREEWLSLYAPLPLGFTAIDLLKQAEASESREAREESGRGLIIHTMALELGKRMRVAEPKRWASSTPEQLVTDLDLHQVAQRYWDHYMHVMLLERQMYADAILSLRPITHSHERAQPYLEGLEQAMQALQAWGNRGPQAPPPPAPAAATRAAAKASAGAGGGMGAKAKGVGMGMGKKGGGKKKAGKR